MVHSAWNGTGYPVSRNEFWSAFMKRCSDRKRRIWETPIVATTSTSRGASNSRRTMPSSISAPRTPPSARATGRATQYGTPQSTTALPKSTAQTTPRLPWAKFTKRPDL